MSREPLLLISATLEVGLRDSPVELLSSFRAKDLPPNTSVPCLRFILFLCTRKLWVFTVKPQHDFPPSLPEGLNQSGWHLVSHGGELLLLNSVSPMFCPRKALCCMPIRQKRSTRCLPALFPFVNFQFFPGSQIWNRDAGNLF